MMVAHCGMGAGVPTFLSHLEPFLSVSKPVGPGRDNRSVDVMWVQYLMMRLARDSFAQYPMVDRWSNAFLAAERKAGKMFAIDGAWGGRTAEMILTYQSLDLNMPLNRGGENTYMEMKADGVVHPAPAGGTAAPVTAAGELYTIAHMSERFRVIHLSYQNYVLTDGDAPQALKAEVGRLMPRNDDYLSAPGLGASLQVARARHFSPRP